MAWLYLLVAGLLEVVWAMAMKYSNGFTRLWPSVILVTAMAGSVYLLAQAVKTMPIGTAYAIWTGIGAVGAVVFGIVLLGEPRSLARLAFVALILIGIIGLHWTSGE